MVCSPAQLAANRRNAQLSRGPATPEGKARSRRNALKHGLTGEGIVLPTEDAAEVERRFEAIGRELKPQGDLAEYFARRVATMTVRVERCVRQETAALSERVRHAESRFDEQRISEAELAFRNLSTDPAANVRLLRRSLEGVDLMIRAWLGIKEDVAKPFWGRPVADHVRMAENLLGLTPCDLPTTRARALLMAADGNPSLLRPEDGTDLEPSDRLARAKERLHELIDGEVARLRAHRETIDLEAIARDRAEAPDRALFDPSKEATLARKYEAAAERNLYKALRALEEANAAASAEDVAEEAPDLDEMGSSFPEPADPARPKPSPPTRPVLPPSDRFPAPPIPTSGAWDTVPMSIGRAQIGAA